MIRILVFLSFGALFGLAQAQGDLPTDPLAWLGRVASAGQRLNFSGTFIYQSGKHFETSRITRVVDASGEYERLEVLDGSPREVIRNNSEVRCVLPDQKLVIVDQPGGRRAFPARVPASFSVLAENYRIRKGEVGRVAGRDAQLIVLEPKDDLRYAHMFWVDMQSGLLLKARLLNERGETIEQFTFSEVRIGGDADRSLFKSTVGGKAGWRVVDARGTEVRKEDTGWMLNGPLPGFALVQTVRRPLGPDRGEAVHIVYSDGLASISVFIEPQGAGSAAREAGGVGNGSINIYKRSLGNYLVTALGEVPMRAVERIGEGIAPVSK